MKMKSIRTKTFLNLFAVMILLIAIIHISIFFIYRNFYINNHVRQIDTDMKCVAEILSATDDCDAVLSTYVKSNDVNIWFSTGELTKFYHGSDTYVEYFSDKDSLVTVEGMEGTESMLFKTQEITLKNGITATVQLSMNLQALKESRGLAISLLPYSFLVSLVFSLLFSSFYSKKITAPILNMSKTLKQMTELEADARIVIDNQDELGVLGEDINQLYQNLLQIIDDYKIRTEEVMHLERERLNFFRGASHELKTPLAKLSVMTENMKYNIGKYKDHDRYLSESLTVIQELSDMISEILDGVKNMKEEEEARLMPVKSCLEKVIENYRLIAKSRHLNLQTELIGDLKLRILPSELEKVLSNVISNAVKYAVEGGEIRISLTDRKLRIYNEAKPIPEEIMTTIWKGEYILDTKNTAGSSGLGLFIVKTLLDRYQIPYSFGPELKGYLFQIGE